MVETVLLLVSSLLLGIGSLVLAGWLVISHQFASLDGIFLTFVCLVMALVFFLNCAWSLRSEEFRQLMQNRSKQ
ncbi:MAG TPA: hypothetical protein VFS12_12180 [Terriglobia bacterium]|nr:hypothetical protein [Terriglobia bacterium]